MKLALDKIKLRSEIDRFEILHWGVFFFLFLAIFYEAIEFGRWVEFLIETIFFTGYFFFVRRLLKRLSYSFWPFLGILFAFLIFKLFNQPFWSFSFLCYFLASGLLIMESYHLWTPIFYPIVSWWEYDFRYRDDLKVQVHWNDEKFEGRLTDLRRNAGCVASFKDLKLGEKIQIHPFQDFDKVAFDAEIMSKRKYSIGRPFNYGVKFSVYDMKDATAERMYKNFCSFWKDERKNKLKKKFTRDKQ